MTAAIVIALIALMVGMSAWGIRHIPAEQRMAIHWNIRGQADGFARRNVALAMLPGVAVVLVVVIALLGQISPPHPGNTSGAVRSATLIAVSVILCIAHGFIIAAAMRAGRGNDHAV